MFRSATSADGFFEEDGELWSRDGVLLAHSRQLALLVGGRDDRLPRPGLERRRPPREPAGRGRRAARATASPSSASSSTYDTDPVGEVLDQPSFLNACVRIETDLEPEELLDACKAVERELGRDLQGGCATARGPIDVDLLLLGDARVLARSA